MPRTKAERLVADLFRIQPKLRKMLLIQEDLWTPDVIAELQAKGYIMMSHIETGFFAVPCMIFTTHAIDTLSKEEVTYEKTSTYLSTHRPGSDASGGGGTIQQDCDTCGSSGDERDEDGKAPSGGSR